MTSISSVAAIGQMFADPSRAAILVALMDGRALTAGELARSCGIAPSTASGHLKILRDAGLLELARQGRHRYYRLASASVAGLIEAIMGAAAEHGAQPIARPLFTGPREEALRLARTCYDHLAGSIGVAISDVMQTREYLVLGLEGGALTDGGIEFLTGIGVELAKSPGSASTLFCKPCLDWSERRTHIGGSVGASLYRHMLGDGWVRSRSGTRAVEITPRGNAQLWNRFGIKSQAM